MEIRPIFSAMMRNRTGAVLIAMQIAVTLAIVVNAIFIIHQRLQHMARPTGLDDDNIISVHAMGIGNNVDPRVTIPRDIDLLRAIPGVLSISTVGDIPFSGHGNVSTMHSTSEDSPDRKSANANMLYADENAIETMGVRISQGRDFDVKDIQWGAPGDQSFNSIFPTRVLISASLAEALFPGENALGKLLYNSLGDGAEIIGIIEHIYGTHINWNQVGQVMLIPKVSGGGHITYLIRTEPGMAKELIPIVDDALANDRYRLVEQVKILSDIKARAYRNDSAITIILSIVVVLLLLVTALGIIGLASFSVRQRTKQIGTRRAIGAQRFHILRYFLVENWLMTTLGVVAGTGLAISLNYWLVTEFETPKLDLLYIPITVTAVWLLGLLSVVGPASRAANISPAIATRTV